MREAIDAARTRGDTLGGVFEVIALGVPVGLGSHVQWDRKLDGRLAQALMSIQAIKGVEIGAGVRGGAAAGIAACTTRSSDARARRRPVRSRGSEPRRRARRRHHERRAVVVRAAMKPISTLARPLAVGGSAAGRGGAGGDRAERRLRRAGGGVVGEAMVRDRLAGAVLEKFGGDSMRELRANVASYLERVRSY